MQESAYSLSCDHRKNPFVALKIMSASLRGSSEKKNIVLSDKEVIEVLEKLSFSLPPVPSLLTRHSSSIYFSLIRGCCPSLTPAKCLLCPVMTVTNTLLSRSALCGGVTVEISVHGSR